MVCRFANLAGSGRVCLLTLSLVLPALACGGDEAADPLSGAPSPAVDAQAEPPEEAPRRRLRSPGRPRAPRDVNAPWQALAAQEDDLRRDAVAGLLEAGLTIQELLREAIREARQGRDVGLLADLLSAHPWEALPVLLLQMAQTAPFQRLRLLAALGRRRPRAEAARAVLVVRLFCGASPKLRRAAASALDAVHPLAQARHAWARQRLSAVGMSRATFDAVHGTTPNGRLIRALVVAAEFEADRFGGEDAELLARLFEPTVAGAPRLLAFAKALLAAGGPPRSVVAMLENGGGPALDFVQVLLRERHRLDVALPAVLRLGGRAALLAPDLLLLRTDAVLRPRAFLVLKLLRPSGEVVDAFLAWLEDAGSTPETQAEALDVLAWSAVWERRRVRAAIRAYRASQPPTRPAGRQAADAALAHLGRNALWFAAESRRVVAGTPWLALAGVAAR